MLFKNKYNICIIVLTYNNLRTTKDFISLLYKNTSLKFNLLLFDNNSTDGTQEYLSQIYKKYKNISLFLKKQNIGIIQGRNEAYKCAVDLYNFQYVIFLDNDQMVKKDWLKNHIEMIKSQEADLIGVEAWRLRENDFYPIKKITNPTHSFSYVGCGGMLIKKEIIDKIGLFDDNFMKVYFEDPDFVFRAYDAGYKIGWNYNRIIDHEHSGPLLNKGRREYFMKNWKTFRLKWKDRKPPILKVEK